MENLISRHRNVSVLVAVLFAQVLGLAVQVKRANTTDGTRLIQIWTVSAITPFEKALVWVQNSTSGVWHNYIYLRGLRAENRTLKQQIEQMRLEQVRLSEDAEQARRLQLLLGFKEKFIAKTLAAQVIGSSGSEQSRAVYIDKGTHDGVQPDQAVITADGVVGKVLRSFDSSALVLLVNDQMSGVGVVLEKSRVQGVLRGRANGELAVEKIMSDEALQPGERILTSGGDQVFPKGLYVGTVSQVTPGSESFLNVRVKPGANLSKLEEVLVVTQIDNRLPSVADGERPVRAVDILTQRLPSVPDTPADQPNQSGTPAAATAPNPLSSSAPKVQGASAPQVQGAANLRGGSASQTAGQSLNQQLPATKAAPTATEPGAPRPVAERVKTPATAETKKVPVANAAPPAAVPAGLNHGAAPKSATPTGAVAGQGTVHPTVLPEKPGKTDESNIRPPASKPSAAPGEAKPE